MYGVLEYTRIKISDILLSEKYFSRIYTKVQKPGYSVHTDPSIVIF